MTNHITRRNALALTAAGFASSCADNKEFLTQSVLGKAVPQGGTWSSGVPLPFPVQEIYPCAHNGAIHLGGGFIAENGRITGPTTTHSIWCAFNADQFDEWKDSTPLPTARHHPQMISFKFNLLALAGFESPEAQKAWTMQSSGWKAYKPHRIRRPNAKEYDWQPTPNLPAPCAEAVVGVLGDDTLHFAGGRTPKGEANANWSDHIDTDHHFVLTDLRGEWQTAAPCLTKRNSAAGDVIDGNFHVVGGRTVGGGNVATHEVYDYREDRWRNAAPMPQAQGGLAAAAVDGKLYVFGGEYFDNGGGVYKEAWVYDPATDAWSAIPDMPNPRHGLGAVALDGSIYVIGGALQASGVDTSAIVDIYTP